LFIRGVSPPLSYGFSRPHSSLYPTSYFILDDKVTKASFKGKHFNVFPLKNPLFLISPLLPPQGPVIYKCYSRSEHYNFFSHASYTLRYGSSSTLFDSATNSIFCSFHYSTLYGFSSFQFDSADNSIFCSFHYSTLYSFSSFHLIVPITQFFSLFITQFSTIN